MVLYHDGMPWRDSNFGRDSKGQRRDEDVIPPSVMTNIVPTKRKLPVSPPIAGSALATSTPIQNSERKLVPDGTAGQTDEGNDGNHQQGRYCKTL